MGIQNGRHFGVVGSRGGFILQNGFPSRDGLVVLAFIEQMFGQSKAIGLYKYAVWR